MLLWHIPYQTTFSASEASRPNIWLTCKRELARNPLRTFSGLRDKRVCQVEPVVRFLDLNLINLQSTSLLKLVNIILFVIPHPSDIMINSICLYSCNNAELTALISLLSGSAAMNFLF